MCQTCYSKAEDHRQPMSLKILPGRLQTGKLRHSSAKLQEEVAKTQMEPCHRPTV